MRNVLGLDPLLVHGLWSCARPLHWGTLLNLTKSRGKRCKFVYPVESLCLRSQAWLGFHTPASWGCFEAAVGDTSPMWICCSANPCGFQPRFLTGWLAGCIHTLRFVIICKSTWRPVNTQKSGRIKDIYKGGNALLTGSFHFTLRSNLHVSIILTFATESRALNEIRIQLTASAFWLCRMC